MHNGGFWDSWGHHFVPGFGHGLYGLFIWALIIGVAILLIRFLFGNKD